MAALLMSFAQKIYDNAHVLYMHLIASGEMGMRWYFARVSNNI